MVLRRKSVRFCLSPDKLCHFGNCSPALIEHARDTRSCEKKQRASDVGIRCSWLCTLPQVLRLTSADCLQNRPGSATAACSDRDESSSAHIHVKNAIFVGAEHAYTGHVVRRGRSADNVLHVDTGIGHCSHIEIVA